MSSDQKITCQVCQALVHAIPVHLKNDHPDVALDEYQRTWPHAEIYSEKAKQAIAEHNAKAAMAQPAVAVVATTATVHNIAEARPSGLTKRPMHEVFDLLDSAGKPVKAAMSARGTPVMISTLNAGEHSLFVPDKDPNYIFNIDLLKTVIMGLELSIPTYLWGFHGTGKTTMFEQVASHTGRPLIRIQHTVNTEEAHIVGQMLVKDGSTYFEPGPLLLAMKHGWVYLADEYDFALPNVTAVYQPVLEGKALVIKEAPPEYRLTKPHPNFRFLATGNSNGAGDETGLYQGVQIGNAANYSRFGIVEEVVYMPTKQEVAVVAGQAKIDPKDAEKLVLFADEVRKSFKSGKIGHTVSPRELIRAGQLGLVKGSDWRGGLKLAFSNRLSRTDKQVVDEFAQRIFGGGRE